MYVAAYNYARAGNPDKRIAALLGISQVTLARWKTQRPALAQAIADGRAGRCAVVTAAPTFKDYVYGRLPEDLQALWDEIDALDEAESGIAAVERILAGMGKRQRQSLFLHALVACNFNPSDAMRKLCLTRKDLENWSHEAGFAELVKEIHWHKKNFFEAALVRAVERGDPAAVVFVNKTYNRDRGYNEKFEITVDGNETTQVGKAAAISLDSLELPLEVRKAALAALRQRQAAAAPVTLDAALAPDDADPPESDEN